MCIYIYATTRSIFRRVTPSFSILWQDVPEAPMLAPFVR